MGSTVLSSNEPIAEKPPPKAPIFLTQEERKQLERDEKQRQAEAVCYYNISLNLWVYF